MKKIIVLSLILSACQKTDEKIVPQQALKSAVEVNTTSENGQLQLIEIETDTQFGRSEDWVKITNCYSVLDSINSQSIIIYKAVKH